MSTHNETDWYQHTGMSILLYIEQSCLLCILVKYLVKALICLLGPSRLWSYGCWIYNYLCNQCISPLMLRVQISIKARCTTLGDKVCQWLATGRWFSLGPPVSSTNKTDHHDITEILLKLALNTFKQKIQHLFVFAYLELF